VESEAAVAPDSQGGGREIADSEHRRRYTRAIQQARSLGEDGFQDWFNRSRDTAQALVRGHWDFSLHILTPAVCAHLRTPEDRTALEIGFGGGRILNAACGFFGRTVGIDIHDDHAAVERMLRGLGRTNFLLLRSDGRSIPVQSGSVDFIYSFIVLQHLQSHDAYIGYLEETFRCLRPGGVAQLYHGRWGKLGTLKRLRYWRQGFHELDSSPVNFTSLVLRTPAAKRQARRIGFRVLASGRSFKQVPDGYPRQPGGQEYLTLLKPPS
jgi:SAM-dependent methyltransferase